jgi:hypothetical protein
MPFELRIRRAFGELSTTFETNQELKKKLPQLNEAIQTLEAEGALVARRSREPKPGYEDIYRFTEDGIVELPVSSGQNIDQIGLALFGYDPNLASPQQVFLSSGVKDPTVYMRQPTYKKYFTRTSEGYTLSPEGKRWITEEIIPKIREKTAATKQGTPEAVS